MLCLNDFKPLETLTVVLVVVIQMGENGKHKASKVCYKRAAQTAPERLIFVRTHGSEKTWV